MQIAISETNETLEWLAWIAAESNAKCSREKLEKGKIFFVSSSN